MVILAIILTISLVGQIILTFFFYNLSGIEVLRHIGWIILLLSAILGWLPIFTFKKKGNVKGKSYIHTTTLVDTGIYAILRHPQYMSGILLSIAISLIAQHWLVIVLGIISGVIFYINTFDEEKSTIEKFGDEYKKYMEKVPRINFIAGIIRLIKK